MLPDHLEFKFLEQRLQILTLEPNPTNHLFDKYFIETQPCLFILTAAFTQHNGLW